MKAAQVRSTFLDFFVAHGHERVASSSLVPANDPTLLFTNAGMVQFKDVFTGREKRPILRATSAQKCVRAGGKHNDLDEVGRTARHQTFFEMLGNFSFGDYFKEEAIAWAWELLTDCYGLDPNRLIVTIFSGDDDMGVPADAQARDIWRRVTGFPDQRIVGLGTAENFWMMGDVGPMGPCSEIHYCHADELPEQLPASHAPSSAWDDWVEIWNLVFMQYERREAGGPLHPLPAPSIDTGAGLERLTTVLQGVDSNYDTDLFAPLLSCAAEIARTRYGGGRDDFSLRVIADHARAVAFLIADGVFPDKTGREYVLRRIFRRAVRHGKLLGIEEPFMHRVCAQVIENMADVYPELRERQSIIHEVTLEEEKRFRATLDRGLGILEEEFEALGAAGKRVVDGAKVFQLYDTFGFPEDLTEIIAAERGFATDTRGFNEELARARERSRFAGSDTTAIEDIYKDLAAELGATEFLGYDGDGTRGTGTVLALVVEGKRVDRARLEQPVVMVSDRTPFYGEAGGQIGDAGRAIATAGEVRIDDTRKPTGDLHLHLGVVVRGEIKVGERLQFDVDRERRDLIRANHSATHLLHLALKKILGKHVVQKGSLVAPDRLRFDFSHFSAMTAEQKQAVEDWVNAEIRANRDTVTEILGQKEARQRGAVAMFGEKYGDRVRVVRIGNESLEFCGGTHVHRSGDIGIFKIVGESSIAQGVRRLEAVTGAGALAYLRRVENELYEAGNRLKAAPFEVAERIDKLQGENKALEREVAALKAKLASGGARDLLAKVQEIEGVKVLAVQTEVADAKTLRETGDALRNRLGSGIVLLAGIAGDKVSLVAMVSDDLTDRFHAGRLLESVARVMGGRGGGRAEMAQGGGRDASKIGQALAQAADYVRSVARAKERRAN